MMFTRQVKIEITKKLKVCQQNLQALGVKRQTSAEQSQYLMGIAMEYQQLAGEALLSNYGRTDVFDQNPALRLATAVVNRSNEMSEVMAMKGHTFHFEAKKTTKNSKKTWDDPEDPSLPAIGVAAMNIGDGDPDGTVEIRKVPDHPELEDLVSASEKLPEPRSGSFHV